MLRASLVAFVFCALPSTAWSPAPAAQLRQCGLQPARAAVAWRAAQPPRALLGAASARRQGASLLAAAAPAPALRPVALLAKAIVSAICSTLLFTTRALAAERLKSPVAASAAPFVLSADVLKWGGLAAIFGTAYLFRRPETPIVFETPTEEPVASDAAVDGEAVELDMMSDLRKRMMVLAEEREAAEKAQEEEPPTTSEDSWGTGSTAVLEPPKPEDGPPARGLLEDGPVVDFPVGFPLRDVDGAPPATAPELAEPPEPTASEEEIAMLERMFGVRGDQ